MQKERSRSRAKVATRRKLRRALVLPPDGKYNGLRLAVVQVDAEVVALDGLVVPLRRRLRDEHQLDCHLGVHLRRNVQDAAAEPALQERPGVASA